MIEDLKTMNELEELMSDDGGPAVIEGVDRDGLEEGREPCLTSPVPPDLSHHRVGGVEGGL